MRNAKTLEYGFSNEEFEIRLQRAQELLYQNKLDALLITIPSNLRYFTGIDTNFWESHQTVVSSLTTFWNSYSHNT